MEIVKEFGINPVLLLAQIVNFTILLLILKRFIYKPILKSLDERKSKIAKSLREAEEIERKFQKISEEQAAILNKARTEASELISATKEEAKQLTEKSLAQTKESMQDLLNKNQDRLALEKDQMMLDAKKELTDLVMLATSRVAKRSVSKDTDRKLVAEVIKSFTKNEDK